MGSSVCIPNVQVSPISVQFPQFWQAPNRLQCLGSMSARQYFLACACANSVSKLASCRADLQPAPCQARDEPIYQPVIRRSGSISQLSRQAAETCKKQRSSYTCETCCPTSWTVHEGSCSRVIACEEHQGR